MSDQLKKLKRKKPSLSLGEGDVVHFMAGASVEVSGTWVKFEFGLDYILKEGEDEEILEQVMDFVDYQYNQKIKEILS